MLKQILKKCWQILSNKLAPPLLVLTLSFIIVSLIWMSWRMISVFWFKRSINFRIVFKKNRSKLLFNLSTSLLYAIILFYINTIFTVSTDCFFNFTHLYASIVYGTFIFSKNTCLSQKWLRVNQFSENWIIVPCFEKFPCVFHI